jgi:hypothetical protein
MNKPFKSAMDLNKEAKVKAETFIMDEGEEEADLSLTNLL